MSYKLSRDNSTKWSESDGSSHKSTKQLPKFDHHLGNFSTRLLDVGCNEHKVVEWKAYEEGKKKSLVRRRSCSIDDKQLGLKHDKDQSKDLATNVKSEDIRLEIAKRKNKTYVNQKKMGTMQIVERHSF
jgi:hypothetical protein